MQLRALASRLLAIQIDSVNVLVRSHYLPAFSRLGPYPTAKLDQLTHERRELFEYWGHAASLIPVGLHPLLRWRMESHSSRRWGAVPGKKKRYVEDILAEVADRGALTAAELKDPGKRSGPWWGWGEGKMALELLYASGRIAVAGRRGFEKVYDLAERVIPASILAAPTPTPDESKRELLALSAGALGIATAKDLASYFVIHGWGEGSPANGKRAPSQLNRLINELVEEGRLIPVHIENWRQTAYMPRSTKPPRAPNTRALVSPFDSLIWERERTARLFGFRYRIEIYVPRPKRVYGYYVLPFLLDDSLVARVDLKADRKSHTLLVPGAFREPGTDGKHVAGELAEELHRMADWLGLETIEVGTRGNLSSALRKAI